MLFNPPDVITDDEIRVILSVHLMAELIDVDIRKDTVRRLDAESEINRYVEAAIKMWHGESLTASEEAIYYKIEYRRQRKREDEAVRILHSRGGRQDERLRNAARHMGWITDVSASGGDKKHRISALLSRPKNLAS